MKRYFEVFDLIELQSTFYKLPSVETAKKWRDEAPPNFIYTMKAWQALTHPPSSPTWRKSGLKISSEDYGKYGHLKPTRENFQAWERTLEVARALMCSVLVLQMSPSFIKSNENISNVVSFLNNVERPQGLVIGIEFRHNSWDVETIRKLCEKLEIIHIVDPFKQSLATTLSQVIYYRLHGLGRRAYVYDYSMEELRHLYERWVKPYEKDKIVYVLFNNTNMANDALDFKKIVVT
ncbi:MAG: DUF72 domain-containing protein [Candidatus Nezhaarchaeales archaeon]|nr:MAG: DUF72 domain-containing protein [Candidatus Nezhaarchaeota archaeon WYZ-LMO8]TDA36960.1 MAG: DUF72 domain-containing protein [Candidatus Nezhaarchaeota archaeon WYZ-LMO7]